MTKDPMKTYAAYFKSGDTWYLYSWDIKQETVPEVAETILREMECESIKFETSAPFNYPIEYK